MKRPIKPSTPVAEPTYTKRGRPEPGLGIASLRYTPNAEVPSGLQQRHDALDGGEGLANEGREKLDNSYKLSASE